MIRVKAWMELFDLQEAREVWMDKGPGAGVEGLFLQPQQGLRAVGRRRKDAVVS